ncbi:hypothetical protein [Streptomyces sp. NPDC004284]|uniref:hypothetical protein n=1 Tax=Streptomyces sp. NPDC004284 TaxID=3364695 RepID=UPI003696E55E
MSAETFFFRFVDGESVALDVEAFRRAVEPYVVAGSVDAGEVLLRAEDGGEAEFHVPTDGAVTSLTAMHISLGAMPDVVAGIADALGAVIFPVGGPAEIRHEDERRHLPPELRGEAIVRS